MFPDYNKDICSIVGPMDSAPVCVDFKHKLNSRSSKSDVSRETFLGGSLINVAFSLASLQAVCCLGTIQPMPKPLRFLLGLSWCHYTMQSAVLIDNAYFLYYDFYSLSLLRAPGMQAPGINFKNFLDNMRRETLCRNLFHDLCLLSLSSYEKS